jgi:hypothetical protein
MTTLTDKAMIETAAERAQRYLEAATEADGFAAEARRRGNINNCIKFADAAGQLRSEAAYFLERSKDKPTNETLRPLNAEQWAAVEKLLQQAAYYDELDFEAVRRGELNRSVEFASIAMELRIEARCIEFGEVYGSNDH